MRPNLPFANGHHLPSRNRSRTLRPLPPLVALLAAAALIAGCAETMQPGDAPPLASTAWMAEDIGGSVVIDDVRSTMEFDDSGGVSGDAGCNRYSGSATVEAEAITFSPLAATRMACVPAVDDQEQRFFDALGRTTGYELRINGAVLALNDADGTPVMTLIRVE